jgi:hypothetical protein
MPFDQIIHPLVHAAMNPKALSEFFSNGAMRDSADAM